jgi:hypothetical protein
MTADTTVIESCTFEADVAKLLHLPRAVAHAMRSDFT